MFVYNKIRRGKGNSLAVLINQSMCIGFVTRYQHENQKLPVMNLPQQLLETSRFSESSSNV
jgi:hypothetical protein